MSNTEYRLFVPCDTSCLQIISQHLVLCVVDFQISFSLHLYTTYFLPDPPWAWWTRPYRTKTTNQTETGAEVLKLKSKDSKIVWRKFPLFCQSFYQLSFFVIKLSFYSKFPWARYWPTAVVWMVTLTFNEQLCRCVKVWEFVSLLLAIKEILDFSDEFCSYLWFWTCHHVTYMGFQMFTIGLQIAAW